MIRSRLLILVAAALWSSAGAVMKLCSLSGWQIAGGRSLVAALFLFAAVREARRRPDLEVVLTSLAYAATVVSFSIANKLTTSANAIFIQDTAPLWVLLLSPWLLAERASRAALLSVPVYALGLALFFVDELSPGQVTGNLVALASGVAFALCIIGLRRVQERAASALVWGNLCAALLTLPLWFSGPAPTTLDLGFVAYLGVFQLGLSYLCFARGVAHTPALEASLLALLEPVLNPIWTFIFVGERPGPWALCGGSIVLAATVWRTLAPLVAARVARQPLSSG
jgi:drug/metabolite transporter, DME family